MDDNLGERFANYLESKLDGAEEVEVSDLSRILAGASRETYRVGVRYRMGGKLQADEPDRSLPRTQGLREGLPRVEEVPVHSGWRRGTTVGP